MAKRPMENNNKTILICGAYGQIGKCIIKEIVTSSNLRIIAIGRNQQKLNELLNEENEGQISTACLDITNLKELRKLCLNADILVNCIGPYIKEGYQTAKIAIEAGIHYIDFSAEQEHYRRLKRLDKLSLTHKVVVATGIGFYPGLSGLLLLKLKALFPEANEGFLSLLMDKQIGKGGGISSILGAVLEMNYPMLTIQNKRLKTISPCSKKTINFPKPFGKKQLMAWPNSEILSLSEFENWKNLSSYIKIGQSPIPSKLSVAFIRLLKPHKFAFTYNLLSHIIRKREAHTYDGDTQKESDLSAISLVKLKSEKQEIEGYIVGKSELAMSYLPVKAILLLLETKIKGGVLSSQQLFNPEIILADVQKHPDIFELKINELINIRATGNKA